MEANTKGNKMKAQEMIEGGIYEIRGEAYLIHEISKAHYDKNGNARRYSLENWDGDIITLTLMNHVKVEDLNDQPY